MSNPPAPDKGLASAAHHLAPLLTFLVTLSRAKSLARH